MNFKQTIGVIAVALAAVLQAEAKTTLFKNGTIHPVSGAEIPNGAVLVEDGKIKEVGAEITASADEVVDLGGLHLFPGLISPGSFLGLVEIAGIKPTRDFAEVGDYSPEVNSWLAVNPDSELIAPARLNGITHVLTVPGGGRYTAGAGMYKIVSGYSGVVKMEGWTTEDMLVKGPVALHLFWPTMQLDTRPKEALPEAERERHKSLEEQAKERRNQLKEIDDFFSEAEAYFKAELKENQKVPAWEAMGPFIRGEASLMLHANDLRQIKAALKWSESRKYKIILAGAQDAWMLAEELAAKKIPVIYDCIFNMGGGFFATDYRDVDPYDAAFKAPAILHKAGVKVAFSEGLSGDGATSLRNLPYSAGHARAFGLPEAEAIKGITLYPAEMLGLAERLGSIEAGKDATFFTCTGSILDARAQVKQVWIEGKAIPMESRHTRLYEKYRNRPKRD